MKATNRLVQLRNEEFAQQDAIKTQIQAQRTVESSEPSLQDRYTAAKVEERQLTARIAEIFGEMQVLEKRLENDQMERTVFGRGTLSPDDRRDIGLELTRLVGERNECVRRRDAAKRNADCMRFNGEWSAYQGNPVR
jgi:hypothetical protein